VKIGNNDRSSGAQRVENSADARRSRQCGRPPFSGFHFSIVRNALQMTAVE